MRHRCCRLLEQLKYASPLGQLLTTIRASLRGHKGPVVGYGTIRKLEASGMGSLEKVAQLKLEGLRKLGVATRFAKQIVSYFQCASSRD
jgi:hypothetical protein